MNGKTIQYFFDDGEKVAFVDLREHHHSVKCHPRDIRVIDPPDRDTPKMREKIAIDIRIGEGDNPIGVAKGMKQ